MISLTNNWNHGLINNHQPVLINCHHLNQLIFHCFILLALTFTVQSESNLTTINELPTTISLTDSEDDLTTSYNFFNPVTLVTNNLTSITESPLTIDLSTNPISVSNSKINNLNLSTTNHVDHNETTTTASSTTTTTTTIKPTTTINPSHVTLFLDGDDEVNTLTTINFDGISNNLTDLDAIHSNEIINSSSSPTTINNIFKSPTLPNTEYETTTTINFNQSSSSIDSETTTTVTIEMINSSETIKSNVISSTQNNDTTLSSSSSSTNLVIDTTNQTICDSSKKQIADHNNQRLTIDHYEAKKFFLFTMILLGLCCLLILIVLILVVYIFRKLTRERTIKIPQVNNNNHVTGGRGGGSIEFDTIKDGRFYQWQGNVNSAFDCGDLNESTTQSTGYRFLEGSVVPYTDRYHNDLKASSTETFGHHNPSPTPNNQPQYLNQPHHLNQSSQSSTSINSLPKSAPITTTVDTRL